MELMSVEQKDGCGGGGNRDGKDDVVQWCVCVCSNELYFILAGMGKEKKGKRIYVVRWSIYLSWVM